MVRADALTRTRRVDELPSEIGTFAGRHHPAHHVPAEDVEHHVQRVTGPLLRPTKLGSKSAPHLIGSCGQQLRFLVRRMDELIAPLAYLVVFL